MSVSAYCTVRAPESPRAVNPGDATGILTRKRKTTVCNRIEAHLVRRFIAGLLQAFQVPFQIHTLQMLPPASGCRRDRWCRANSFSGPLRDSNLGDFVVLDEKLPFGD